MSGGASICQPDCRSSAPATSRCRRRSRSAPAPSRWRYAGPPLPAPAARDGEYFAALYIYQGEQVRAQLPFLSFRRQGGRISAVTPLNLALAFVPLASPSERAEASFSGMVRLSRFELSATTARPG